MMISIIQQKPVPLHGGDTPSPTSVREWSFCDILKLLKKEKEEWKTACRDELEALKRRRDEKFLRSPTYLRVIK
jgi:hypothetical protein